MVVREHEAIRDAYANLLACADAAYHATDLQLNRIRGADGADAETARGLETRLAQTTELIDLLESAVAQAIQNLTATENQPAGQG